MTEAGEKVAKLKKNCHKFIFFLFCFAWFLTQTSASFYLQVDEGRATISGDLSGNVAIEKIGAGTAVISGNNTYTGNTVVSEGSLVVNSAIPGDAIIGSDASLGGVGVVGGSVDNTHGGTVTDKLNITNNYSQGSTSTLLIHASAPSAGSNLSTFDCLNIIGSATLDGYFVAYVNSGVYDVVTGVTFPVLVAQGGITGTFAGLPTHAVGSTTSSTLSLHYISGSVFLNVKGAGLTTYNGNTSTVVDIDAAIKNATGPITIVNVSDMDAESLVSTAVPLTLENCTVNASSTIDLSSAPPLTTSPGTTTTWNGGGNTIIFNVDGTASQGNFIFQNGNFTVNTDSATPLAAPSVTVGNGATLQGRGYFSGSVSNDGTVRPGGSVGTMTVNGNYSGTGNLQIQFNDTPSGGGYYESSFLSVKGNADLSGTTLQIIPEVTTEAGADQGKVTNTITLLNGQKYLYRIIEAQSILSDSLVIQNPNKNGLKAFLSYSETTPNNLLLTLEATEGDVQFAAGDQVLTLGSLTPVDGFFSAAVSPSYSSTTIAEAKLGLRLDAEEHGNAILAAVSSITSTASSTTFDLKTDFWSSGSGKQAPLTKGSNSLEFLVNILEASGPKEFANDQGRLWITSYKNSSRVSALGQMSGSRSSTVGALMGGEYRALPQHFTLGAFVGTLVGKKKEVENPDTCIKSRGINYGLYSSLSFCDGARVDVIATNLHMNLNASRFENNNRQIAVSKYPVTVSIVDTMASYRWKLPSYYSLRLNAGNTFAGSKVAGYQETGAGFYNNKVTASSSKTNEVYGGLGVRKGWKLEEILLRLTGSYEMGYQYMQSGKPVVVSSSLSLPVVVSRGPLCLNHYFNLNFSILDERRGLKLILAYTTVLSPEKRGKPRSLSQTYSLKGECRF